MITWSETHKGSNVILSNNNMTAYHTSHTGGAVRASEGKSIRSGKWYWEVKITGTQNNGDFGICSEVFDFSQRTSPGFNEDNKNYIAVSSDSLVSSTTKLIGKILRFFLDYNNNILTVQVEDQESNSIPIGDLSGVEWYPFVSSRSVSSDFYSEINLGDSPFSFTIPRGYIAYSHIPNKTLILFQNEYYKYDWNTGEWVNLGTEPSTVEAKEVLFQEEGMEDTSELSSEIISQLSNSNVKILTYVPN